MSTAALFSPYRLMGPELPSRIVMAPMTRNRAGEGNAPTELNAAYYAQRATLALLIAEGTQPTATGQGYPGTPGLHSDEQEAGWRTVAKAVHDAGGRILVQLMHAGRISHPALLPNGALPAAPSAVRPGGETFAGAGTAPFVTPRPLELDELPAVIAAFVDAARRAVRAGARRRRAPRRQRLPPAPVPCHRHQSAGRRLRRLGRRPHPLRHRDGRRDGRRDRRQPRRHPHLAGQPIQRHARG
jgi:2,4-dienoyl-CoA reductase-like NADH-dependent reductase (Old Yellow Enzyme family)